MSRRQGACGKNFTNKLSSNYNDVIICNDSTNIESHSYNLTLQKSLRLPLNMRLHLSGLRLPLRLCISESSLRQKRKTPSQDDYLLKSSKNLFTSLTKAPLSI